MKNIASLVYLTLGVLACHGQGTLQFAAHLTSPAIDYTGDGTFFLTADLFSYNLQTHYGYFQANIQGPGPDATAPVIFSLHNTSCRPPLGPDPGGCWFSGSVTLSGDEVADLTAGRWYVNGIPDPSTDPIYTLRGQITSVPEPRVQNLIWLVAGIWLVYGSVRWRKAASRPRSGTSSCFGFSKRLWELRPKRET